GTEPATTTAASAAVPAPRLATRSTLPRTQPQPGRTGQVAPAPGVATAQPGGPDPADRIDRATIDRLKLDRGPARGPIDAPVTITMFTDMQCPYCERSEATLDQLFEDYPNKLRLVLKQMPVHKTARLAAEAGLAADAQG